MKLLMPNVTGFRPEEMELHPLARSLGNAVDARDASTFNHSAEVAVMSRLLAVTMELPPEEVEAVHIAGHLHDIGKIGVPDAVLRKSGKLTAAEWELMKRHPEVGAEIIRPVNAFSGIAEMILCHHERFDGTGYPFGCRGENIPLGARIIAVADTLSALLQDRPYREATEFGSAWSELTRCAGTQFDPRVVEAAEKAKQSLCRHFHSRTSPHHPSQHLHLVP